MKKDNNSKPDNKRGFPGILILFIVGLIVILAFQNLSNQQRANVSFSHQLEHLVNLDLIDPNENKKIALNDNLVTFSGKFRENLTETAKERYRYLSLLNSHHDLIARKQQVISDLDRLQQQVFNSSLYFLQISGIRFPERGFVVVPKNLDTSDRQNAIIVESSPLDKSVITLPEVTQYLNSANAAATATNIHKFGDSLNVLLQEFRSPKIGIGSEKYKKTLRIAQARVESTLNDSNMSSAEKFATYKIELKNLQTVIRELTALQNDVRLYDLRSVRNYMEYLELYSSISIESAKNLAQLQKAQTKVASVIWFFNNQEITTKALEGKDPEKFQQWFSQTEKEWGQFQTNKGLGFKAPDQPRNVILEKTFKSEEPAHNYFSYLITFLPIILIAFVLYFIFSRQMKGGGSSAMNFGKSPAKMLNKSTQKVTFSDVAGIDEAKEELEEVVDFLKDPTRYTKLGARIPKGVLLIGSPGTGKTLIAKAVAGEAGVPFFSISGSDFVEMFVGVGASRVRDLFEQAKKNSPCIIFIDEIDAVGRHRGSGLGGGHDEREQTLNQLLVEVDGMESSEGVIIIAATNRPDVLDSALQRPGRFDRTVMVDLPDFKGRLEILKVHTRNVKIADDVDLKEMANRTPGASGADIQNMINEAALFAARKKRSAVTQQDLRYAQEKVTFGKERKSHVMDEEDKCTTAWHEAGHAFIGLHLNTPDKVSKVTCIARGRSLGATHFEQKKNRVNYKKQELIDQLAVLMGGRVAEEIINKDSSSGAQMDIKQATSIARSMVCEWGMSDKVGMVNFGEDSQKNLMAGFQEREYSETTANMIDEEVKRLCDEAYLRAKSLLEENYDVLKLMAETLLEFETLEREDLDKIMDGTFNHEEKRAKLMDFQAKLQKAPPPPPDSLKKKNKTKINDRLEPHTP